MCLRIWHAPPVSREEKEDQGAANIRMQHGKICLVLAAAGGGV